MHRSIAQPPSAQRGRGSLAVPLARRHTHVRRNAPGLQPDRNGGPRLQPAGRTRAHLVGDRCTDGAELRALRPEALWLLPVRRAAMQIPHGDEEIGAGGDREAAKDVVLERATDENGRLRVEPHRFVQHTRREAQLTQRVGRRQRVAEDLVDLRSTLASLQQQRLRSSASAATQQRFGRGGCAWRHNGAGVGQAAHSCAPAASLQRRCWRRQSRLGAAQYRCHAEAAATQKAVPPHRRGRYVRR